jgi:hypothetical protein
LATLDALDCLALSQQRHGIGGEFLAQVMTEGDGISPFRLKILQGS